VIAAWVVFPLLLSALALGCGLLVDRTVGGSLPGTLLAPVGLAGIVVVSHLLTLTDTTADLAAPATVALALVGFIVSRARPRAIDWAAAGAAAAVFCVYAAPVVLSGDATFAGYIKLDDTATWLAITDHVLEHGRDVGMLADSTHEATLEINVGGGYPIGTFLPLAVGAALLPTDPAWLFQPFQCLLAAMLALALYELTGRLIECRGLRAAVAFVGAQPALLFAYSLWGGVKEIAAAALVALLAALLPWVVERLGTARLAVPALVAAAIIAVLSFGGVVWLALPLLAALVAAVRSHPPRQLALATGAFAALTAVLALPSLLTAEVFLRPAAGVVTSDQELGNLIEPLRVGQIAGVWPAGDFRVDPDDAGLTSLLVVLTVLAASAGIAVALARRRWGPAAFGAGTLASGLVIVAAASPWIEAKALATASPAVLTLALVACAVVIERNLRAVGAFAGAAIAAGVVWSNALAYHDVNLASRERLEDLERIGERIEGEGPALMTEYEPYGVRHFLREADAEGASELRRRVVYLRRGGFLDKGASADIDAFGLSDVLVYRTLVLRRSPTASRPPSVYTRTMTTGSYEVWQRPPGSEGRIVEHLALNGTDTPLGTPECAEVQRLARVAGPGGRLLASTLPAPAIHALGPRAPAGWAPGSSQNVVVPGGSGELTVDIETPAAPVELWLYGSVRRTLVVTLDGDEVARIRHRLEPSGGYIPLGRIQPDAGRHRVGLRIEGSALKPGEGGGDPALGPLVTSVATADGPPPLIDAAPADARKLCREGIDWIEAVRG
jgi:hypothetical protein